MSKDLESVASRRLELLEKIEAQRMEMAEISGHFQRPLALVNTGLKGVRFIQSHPVLMAGSVAALLTLRRTGIVGWIQKGRRLLYLYPFILSFGLKSLSSTTHTPKETLP